ncbi:MAG TPA: DUF6226 family protein [Actinomycetota bacterium]|jgi:hypothetical protein|nr:DUF6226 family protein [Actinomycetota bacterium]
MSRGRWGIEGPPPEAYSRVTDPERFQPLHSFAEGLAARLEAGFDVERTEGYGLDAELERMGTTRPTIRLTPRSPRTAPVVFAFTPFPGVVTRSGRWQVDPFPSCGCDACDEDAEDEIERLAWLVDQVTAGRFREAIELPAVGAAWQRVELWSLDGSRRGSGSRLERAEARRRLSGMDQVPFDWEAWPARPGEIL